MDKNIYAEFIAKAELNEVHKVLIASAIPYAIIKGEPLSLNCPKLYGQNKKDPSGRKD